MLVKVGASISSIRRLHIGRSLSLWRNVDRGTMTITVELPIEHGELVVQALDKAAEHGVAEGPELASETWRARQADALVSIAMGHLNGGNGGGAVADHCQVLVHVDESELSQGKGRADPPVESVRLLTCNGSIVRLVENADGEPLKLGRKRRTISTAVRRALAARGGGCCRFPGCTNTKYLHAHHIKHWADGGETDVDNLVPLCTRHHWLCHEGGFTIGRDHEGRLYFRRPDGRVIPTLGYRPEDMVDDDIDASAEGLHQDDASAEATPRDEGIDTEAAVLPGGGWVREPATGYHRIRGDSIQR